ncbi:MAG: group III truncated hemoglobin [Sulfurimonas sp.]|nr:group III truncated hemoglobin [Sulfurimonas sp.]
MLIDTVDRASIEKMVRHFYASLLEDEILKPFFVNKLGDDFNGSRWYEHLKILDNFWMMMMTGQKGYFGDPFPSHAFIGRLTPESFERWLKLFKETVDCFFTPKLADKFYKKATILAAQFMENLGVGEEDDEDYY